MHMSTTLSNTQKNKVLSNLVKETLRDSDIGKIQTAPDKLVRTDKEMRPG
jgi:hypothetical protein